MHRSLQPWPSISPGPVLNECLKSGISSRCPQCGATSLHLSQRLVREGCGHLKCRECLLREDAGCRQCRMAVEIAAHIACLDSNPIKSECLEPEMMTNEAQNTSSETEELLATSIAHSSASSERLPTAEELATLHARVIHIRQWIRVCNFAIIDHELEQAKHVYNGRIHDGLVNLTSNTAIIERGRERGLQLLRLAAKEDLSNHARNLPTPFLPPPLTPLVPSTPMPALTPAPTPAPTPTPTPRRRRRHLIDHTHYSHIVKKTELDPPEYQCTICNRQFKNRLNIRYHIACADASAGHACTLCPRIFKSSSHLTYHMRTAHDAEKPYKCEVCQKRFAQSVKLKRHMRTHTGERPFKCNICNHAFTTKYNLKEHENIHKGAKPHVCKNCNKAAFADRNNLRRHEAACRAQTRLQHEGKQQQEVQQKKEVEVQQQRQLEVQRREIQQQQLLRLKQEREILQEQQYQEQRQQQQHQEQRQQQQHQEQRQQQQLQEQHEAQQQRLQEQHRLREQQLAQHRQLCTQLHQQEKARQNSLGEQSQGYQHPVGNHEPQEMLGSDQHRQSQIAQEMEQSDPMQNPKEQNRQVSQSCVHSEQGVEQEKLEMNQPKRNQRLDCFSTQPSSSLKPNSSKSSKSLACSQIKTLLQSAQGDIYRVVDSLSSAERRALIDIMRHDESFGQPNYHEMGLSFDKFDGFSDISTGSKKEFLRRYKKQVLGLDNSTASSSISLPSAANSISPWERQQLMLDDFGPEEAAHDFPKAAVEGTQSFDHIMQGIHNVISSHEAKSANGNEDKAGSENVRMTERGLRKIGVCFDEEDEEDD